MNYSVSSGDTLSGIALKNGVSLSTLLAANKGITDPNKIAAGQSIVIPQAQASSTPTIQTTTAQRSADSTTEQNYNNMMTAKGYTTAPTTTTAQTTAPTTGQNGQTTTPTATQNGTQQNGTATPTKTPEQLIDSYFTQGYTDPNVIYSKILNSSDGTVDLGAVTSRVAQLNSDVTASGTAQSNAQLRKIDEDRANLDTQFATIKANSDATTQKYLDNITAKFDNLRAVLKSNTDQLLGAREKFNIATGGNRYTTNQSEGLLTNDQNNYVLKLGELASQESELVMQATQAKTKGEWDMLTSYMGQIDKLNDNKTATLKGLSDSLDKSIKQKQAEAKVTQAAGLMGYSDPTKLAQGIAPYILEATQTMNPEQMDAYINQKATEYGVKPDVLKSAILGANNNNMMDEAKLKKLQTPPKTTVKKTGTGTKKLGKFDVIDKYLDSGASIGGVPAIDPNGFINPKGLDIMLQIGRKYGVSRANILKEYGARLYKDEGLTGYDNLTPAEKKALLK